MAIDFRCTVKLGEKYGLLTVVERIPYLKNGKTEGAIWKCQCDCGNFKEVQSVNLTSGKRRSCGCDNFKKVNGNRKFKLEESSLRAKISNYKASARVRNLEYTLTVEEASILLKGDCFYCGQPPSNKYNVITRNRIYTKGKIYCNFNTEEYEILYNGIDRVVNNVGYHNYNCVSCCKRCNQAKMNSSYSDFMNWVSNLINFRKDL